MVISSSGVQISTKADLARRSTLENGTVGHELSNDQTKSRQVLQTEQPSTITDTDTKKKALLPSPIKPIHKLNVAKNYQHQQNSFSKESSPLLRTATSRRIETSKDINDGTNVQKPIIIPKSHSKANDVHQAIIQQQSTTSNASGNSNQNQRQLKQIRNSFNNFFVTSKQSTNGNSTDNKIKFRMSQAEHRNELKNYLELASLAGDHPLQDQAPQRGSSGLYRRANPLIRDDQDGYEAARRESNISQLQALNTANVQLMPALQSSTGFRNHHNRTSLAQAQRSTEQVNDTSSVNTVSTVHKQKSHSNKPDKPY